MKEKLELVEKRAIKKLALASLNSHTVKSLRRFE